jgi:CHASE1-domain containing sensor protein/two-component sensor histidine kinase
LPIAAFLSVALASLAMAGFAYVAAQDATRIKFEATADDALNRIENRLENHLSLLDASHALFKARDGDVSRATFKTFFDAIDFERNFVGLGGIGFASLVKPGNEAAAEGLIANNYGKKLPIYPESDQPWRAAIALFEPIEGTSGIGYDMFTDPDRRAAMTGAMATDGEWATGKVMLGQPASTPAVPGFFVFRRLQIEAPPGEDSAPQSRTAGFLFVTFPLREFFDSVFGRAPVLPLAAEVFDGSPEPNNLLYRSQGWDAEPDGQIVSRKTVVGGRQWTILFQRTAAFEPPTSRAVPLILGSFGLLLAAAIALAARLQIKAYDAAKALQLQTEKSLLEKDLMLQEMKHRIKNSITRMLAIARQAAVGATDVNEFTNTFAARLQAMAASQDVLTRARWQKADLVDLVKIELGQVLGNELSPGTLSGQSVRLDETTTQALGLTFHELATNTLKYGNASGLKVSWEVVREGRNRKLRLHWEEAGQTGMTPPEKTGFGTKLIDMTIERELGGTIRRKFREDGLSVDIEIPLGKQKG